jgi:hypothetical protein
MKSRLKYLGYVPVILIAIASLILVARMWKFTLYGRPGVTVQDNRLDSRPAAVSPRTGPQVTAPEH